MTKRISIIMYVALSFMVLFISIGRAKAIALRNLIVSTLRLLVFYVACVIFESIAIILSSVLLLDIIQIIYFQVVLNKRNHSYIRKY